MAKLTLTDLTSLQNETTAISQINANGALIETALENTLSRDGTSPNAMGAHLDMNSNRILNLPLPSADQEPVRKGDLSTLIEGEVTITTSVDYDEYDEITTVPGDSLVIFDASDTNFPKRDTVADVVSVGITNTSPILANPLVTTLEVGASDTTLAKASAGDLSVEGNIIYRAGGTDVPVTDGGTGASSAEDARTSLGLVIGTNVQAFDADTAKTDTAQNWTAHQYSTPDVLTSTSNAVAWNVSIAQHASHTLTEDTTITPSNGQSGGFYTIRIVQDSTPRAVTWSGVTWPGGVAPTISTGSGNVDIVTLFYDGTSYRGAFQQDFS